MDRAYIGANAGVATEDLREVYDNGALTGGAQIGYRAEFGPAVVGAELQAAKPKAGAGLGSTLIYRTAGYGVARLVSGADGTDASDWHGGVVFGGGVEQKPGGPLSASIEYTRMRLSEVESQTDGVSYSDDLVNHSIKAGLTSISDASNK